MPSYKVKASLSEYVLSGKGWEKSSGGEVCRGTRKRDGASVFIKRYTDIKEPVKDASITEATYAKRMDQFERYVKMRTAINERIRAVSGPGGNLIIPSDEFVCDHLYTEISLFVPGLLTPTDILRASPDDRLVLMKTAINALSTVHHQKVIHVDIKPPNVLAVRNDFGLLVGKIIDFDSSLMSDKPIPAETGGDQVHWSPELAAYSDSEGDPEAARWVSEKTDVFSMGLTLHYYLTGGKLPGFADVTDPRAAERIRKKQAAGAPVFCWEALLGGGRLVIDPSIDGWLADIISKMTRLDPDERPTSQEVAAMLQAGKPPEAPDTFEAPRSADRIAWKTDALRHAGFTGIRPASAPGRYELLKNHVVAQSEDVDALVTLGYAYSTIDQFEDPKPADRLAWNLPRLRDSGYTGIHASGSGMYSLTKNGRPARVCKVDQLVALGYATRVGGSAPVSRPAPAPAPTPAPTPAPPPPPPAGEAGPGFEPPAPEDGIVEWDVAKLQSLGYTGIRSIGGGKYEIYAGSRRQATYTAQRLIQIRYAKPGRAAAAEADVFDLPAGGDGITCWNEDMLKKRGYTGIHPLESGNYALVKNGSRVRELSPSQLLQLGYAE